MTGLRLSGTPLQTVGGHSELTITNRFPGGCYEIEWGMSLPPNYSSPLLRRGARVEVVEGPFTASLGTMSEVDVAEGKFKALGMSNAVASYSALSADGTATTSTPNIAIDRAIADGLQVTRPASISSTPYVTGDATDSLNSLAALLDAWGDANDRRWLVDEAGRLVVVQDPTTPTFFASPGIVQLGETDDEWATRIEFRYYDSGVSNALRFITANETDPRIRERYGIKPFRADGRTLGPMSETKARAIAAGILARSKARLGWTTAVTLNYGEILTPGGVPADLGLVCQSVIGGAMLRIQGLYDDTVSLGGVTYLDVVIGEAKWVAGSQSIVLSPMGKAPTTLAENFEATARKAGFRPFSF